MLPASEEEYPYVRLPDKLFYHSVHLLRGVYFALMSCKWSYAYPFFVGIAPGCCDLAEE